MHNSKENLKYYILTEFPKGKGFHNNYQNNQRNIYLAHCLWKGDSSRAALLLMPAKMVGVGKGGLCQCCSKEITVGADTSVTFHFEMCTPVNPQFGRKRLQTSKILSILPFTFAYITHKLYSCTKPQTCTLLRVCREGIYKNSIIEHNQNRVRVT